MRAGDKDGGWAGELNEKLFKAREGPLPEANI